jgi:hypothetical protein
MRVLFYRIRLTGNAGRALISDQAMNNRQVASAGQAALAAMRQTKRSALPLSTDWPYLKTAWRAR